MDCVAAKVDPTVVLQLVEDIKEMTLEQSSLAGCAYAFLNCNVNKAARNKKGSIFFIIYNLNEL